MAILGSHSVYWVAVLVMMLGLYGTISAGNLFKKILCLSVFQTSVLLFYIALGVMEGGHAPILKNGITQYMNPLPHVLMLTAIVVGIATLAVGIALIIRIQRAYGSVEEEELDIPKARKGNKK